MVHEMRNDTFKFTVDCSDSEDMDRLEVFRKSIKEYNKVNNGSMKIKARGRGPRVAPALLDGFRKSKYYRDLPLRHAKRIDVYLYFGWKFKPIVLPIAGCVV